LHFCLVKLVYLASMAKGVKALFLRQPYDYDRMI